MSSTQNNPSVEFNYKGETLVAPVSILEPSVVSVDVSIAMQTVDCIAHLTKPTEGPPRNSSSVQSASHVRLRNEAVPRGQRSTAPSGPESKDVPV